MNIHMEKYISLVQFIRSFPLNLNSDVFNVLRKVFLIDTSEKGKRPVLDA
jgi:hypothetical protein